jgi:hypothetical protein
MTFSMMLYPRSSHLVPGFAYFQRHGVDRVVRTAVEELTPAARSQDHTLVYQYLHGVW